MKTYQGLSIKVTYCCDEDVIRTSSGYADFNEDWFTNSTNPVTVEVFREGGLEQ